MKALKAQVEVEGVLGALDGPEVAHELRRRLGDEGTRLTELLGVDDAVIRLVRGGEAGELLGMGHPVELSGVDDCPSHGDAVPVHVLGGGVRHDVGTPLDRPAVDGRGEGVVDDEGHAVRMCGGGELLDVEDRERGVGDGLAEDALRVGTEGGVELLGRAEGRDERGLDAHLAQRVGEEVERAAVDGRRRHHVTARLADVEHREEVRRLAGAREHARGAALERGDLRRYGIVRRVLQTRVEVARGLEVEELAHVIGGLVPEGRRLDDGHLARLTVSRPVSRLHATRLDALIHGDLSSSSK